MVTYATNELQHRGSSTVKITYEKISSESTISHGFDI